MYVSAVETIESIGDFCCHGTGTINEVTIRDLKPETSYQVQLSAINGKGEGESSAAEFFKTEPVSKWSNQKLISLFFLKRIMLAFLKPSTEDKNPLQSHFRQYLLQL